MSFADGDGGGIGGVADVQAMKAPVGYILNEVGLGRQELGLVWMEGNLERFGCDGEAAADGFQDGLLEGPNFVEDSLAIGVGHAVEALVLVRREDAAREIMDNLPVFDMFDVDADGRTAREGEKGIIAGVRDVKFDARNGWLAVIVLGECKIASGTVEIAAEQSSQHTACDGGAGLIRGEAKAHGLFPLGDGQDRAPILSRLAGEANDPNVNTFADCTHPKVYSVTITLYVSSLGVSQAAPAIGDFCAGAGSHQPDFFLA